MSKFDVVPPLTETGGNGYVFRTLGTVLMNDSPVETVDKVDMEADRQYVPYWNKIYQNSSTQMMLLNMQAFCELAVANILTGEHLILI